MLANIDRSKLEGLSPELRARVEAEIAAAVALTSANPLQRFYPYPKQAEFLAARERTKAFYGGNRAGKTEVGVVDDLIQCVDRACLPKRLLPFKRWEPPFHCRIVFPKFGQGDLAVMEKIRALCPADQLRGGSVDKALEKQPNLRLHFKNGSWIVFNTGDQDRNVHGGVKLHRVHFDEEPLGEKGWGIYQENRNRLVDYAPESQMIFTMTPQEGQTWTLDEILERRDDPDMFCITASMLDNPYLPRGEILKRISELPDEERLMLIEGQYSSMGGRVVNLTDDHYVPVPSREHVQNLDRVFVGIDPGWKRGGVAWVGFDKENVALVFDELYPERLTPEQIAPLIKERNAYWGVEPTYVIDPSAKNANLASGDDVEAAFQREGIYAVHGQNARLAGALQLKARAQAMSLLVVRDNCPKVKWESERWVVATDEDQEQYKAKVKGAGGSFATMGPDHLWDPIRYICMERAWYQRPVQKSERAWSVTSGTTPPKGWHSRPRVTGGPMGPLS